MVLEQTKMFMKIVRREEECDPDLSDAECCELFIGSTRDEIGYYEDESEGAFASPEWEGEYEAYQDHIRDLYHQIGICEKVMKWSKEIGVVKINHISEDDWAEYQSELSQRRMEEYAERGYL